MNEAGSAARSINLFWNTPQPWPQVREELEVLLGNCNQALTARTGDWIGHLKLLIEANGGAAYVSLTGASEVLSWRGALVGPLGQAKLTIYAVVWATPEAVVAAALDEAVDKRVPGIGDRV